MKAKGIGQWDFAFHQNQCMGIYKNTLVVQLAGESATPQHHQKRVG